MSVSLDGPHWRFAVAFYGLPDVAKSCLTLQDTASVDIVHLIFAIYAGRVRNVLLGSDALRESHAYIRSWREAAVVPLRHVRRTLKHPIENVPGEEKESLRNQIKQAELCAEQIQIALFAAWLDTQESKKPKPFAGRSITELVEAVVELYAGASVIGKPSVEVRTAMQKIAQAADETGAGLLGRQT